ncbi:uncharacterized protein LY79DRAFT_251828 [Colletotrichum navitas]|uniref:Uncharacterized protein n=1 Tax=Colletotrichum navitas TaxID=681940 RepID=A0AAD8QAF0_9PEZI|nr:uncharacterized protein LY79DRAFT_251828 [Colletotrichum navitas]KAK1598675.1 hypothetical protein LY79DRAFT_251828 [Colletotrichum navitas]
MLVIERDVAGQSCDVTPPEGGKWECDCLFCRQCLIARSPVGYGKYIIIQLPSGGRGKHRFGWGRKVRVPPDLQTSAPIGSSSTQRADVRTSYACICATSSRGPLLLSQSAESDAVMTVFGRKEGVQTRPQYASVPADGHSGMKSRELSGRRWSERRQ